MKEPYFIVSSTAKEHGDYQRRKDKKQLVASLWIIGLSILACGWGYWQAYQYINIGASVW